MGFWDWVILGAVAVALVFAVAYMVKRRNKCIGCPGDCGSCACAPKK